MYNRLRWRGAAIGIASDHARQVPAVRHSGTAGEFLRRHESELNTTGWKPVGSGKS